MPRSRTDQSLPPRVHVKHGAYYYVRANRWTNLGRDREQALLKAQILSDPTWMTKMQVAHYASKMVAVARNNAKNRRTIAFEITKEDVQQMLEAGQWRCAVTSTPFSLTKINNRRPYAPSIDRIDSSAGYTRDNCRMVCVAANYAMNNWGETVLMTMALYMAKRESLRQRLIPKRTPQQNP